MPTGVVLDPDRSSPNHVAAAIDQARRAYNAGVEQVWIAQQFDHDAISLAGYVGAAVPGLGVGTFVVPVNPRHPLTLASQALTAQAATGGNFSLGLGLGAHGPEQVAFGTAWPNTIGRLREHLQVLRSILGTGTVDFHGEEFTAAPQFPVTIAGGTPLPVYVAAMGPKALRVTGELADGTLPYLAGPLMVALVLRTIEAFKVFDIIWVMTRGGPANSTRTMSILVYQEAFSFQRAGSGASLALIVTLIITVLAVAYGTAVRKVAGSAA